MSYFKRLREAYRLASQAFGDYRYHILLLSLLGFLGGIVEGVGINALIPLINFLTGGAPSTDFITTSIQDVFAYAGINFTFQGLFIFAGTLFLSQVFIILLFDYVKIKIVASYEARARARLFRKTLESRWAHLLNEKLGALETVLMTNIRIGSEMLEHIAQMLITATGLIVYVLVAFNISPSISLITFVFGIAIVFAFRPIMSRVRGASRDTQKVNKQSAHFVNEQIVGLKSVKSLHAEGVVAEIGGRIFETLRRLRVRMFVLRSLNGSLVRPLSLLFAGTIFAVSYKFSVFELASLLAIMYLIQHIFSYFQQFIGHLHRVNESGPFLQNVLLYEAKLEGEKETEAGTESFSFKNVLEFRQVSFTYGTEEFVLQDLDLKVFAGNFIGLVGSSGSGKTTIVDLLLRLLTPTKGKIIIDGRDVGGIKLSDWRKHIGYMSQDVFLLNDTIEQNIKFYDESITDADMMEAAKMANIYDTVMQKPLGFKTKVGERGIFLSAGQRQRVALARVLARKPTILILDEATSALDLESERQIQQVIENMKGKITVIAIAHRVSTLMNADTIFVLHKGKIVESGAPPNLLTTMGSRFKTLVDAGSL